MLVTTSLSKRIHESDNISIVICIGIFCVFNLKECSIKKSKTLGFC